MTRIKLVIVPPEEFGRMASDYIANRIIDFHDRRPMNIGTATGGTMEGIYGSLIERARRDDALANALQTVNYFAMDEYVGLDGDHPQSYAYFMRSRLLEPAAVSTSRLQLPNKENVEPAPGAGGCISMYDQMMTDCGGIDLQLAGIGTNGHVAFNEPGTSRDSWTRRVLLSESTISANSRYFSDPSEVPREAYSIGIATIMRAERVVLFASGKNKASALERMIRGRPGDDCPASVLTLHPNCTVFMDWEAASKLRPY